MVLNSALALLVGSTFAFIYSWQLALVAIAVYPLTAVVWTYRMRRKRLFETRDALLMEQCDKVRTLDYHCRMSLL